MHLKRLTITNYKSFFEPKEFIFEPGFNVLLGANSSGKSSVMEAIYFHELQNSPHRSVLNVINQDTLLNDAPTAELCFVGKAEEFCKLVSPGQDLFIGIGEQSGHFYTQDIESLKHRISTEALMLGIKVNPSTAQLAKITFEGWPAAWRPLNAVAGASVFSVRTSDMEVTAPGSCSLNPEDISQLCSKIQSKIYKFSAERAVQPTSGHSSNELLPNCANLAFCISQLQNSDHVLADRLMGLLNRIFPTVHRVGAPMNGSGMFELRIQTTPTNLNRRDLTVPINQVGTGVGNALAMLYVVLTAQTQRIILLEEPNSFLHPRALRELLAILAEIGGKHQFFVTTHSSDVLRTINASTVTLLEHDGQQTKIQQTAGSKLHELRAGLIDLGIRLTDLHGCDEVIWVEGETEEAIFPKLLRHYFPEKAQGIAVLPLHSTGDFEARKFKTKKVAEIYKRLSEGTFLAPPMVAITLDRETRSDTEIQRIKDDCGDKVHFLPRIMLEDFLLDADAIAALLSQELNETVTSQHVQEVLTKYQKDVACSLKSKNPKGSPPHAAMVLEKVFQEMATREYRKTSDGPQLTDWLLANRPHHFDELHGWFKKFLL
jgi:predicted ATPase